MNIKDVFQKARALPVDEKWIQEGKLELLKRLLSKPIHQDIKTITAPQKAPIPFLFLKPKYMISLILIVALLAGGGGVASAAQNDLPGDALYGVKLATERLQETFVFSPEKKVELKARLVLRRSEELEKITEPQTEALREEVISGATARFESQLQEMAKTMAELPDEAKLRISPKIMELISQSLPNLEKMKIQLAVNQKGDEKADEAIKVALETESKVIKEEQEAAIKQPSIVGLRERAEGKIGAATNKLEEVQRMIEKFDGELLKIQAGLQTKLEDKSIKAAKTKFQEAQAVLADAGTKLKAAAYAEAFVRAGESMQLANEAKQLLKQAEKEIKETKEKAEKGGEEKVKKASGNGLEKQKAEEVEKEQRNRKDRPSEVEGDKNGRSSDKRKDL